MKVIKCFKKQMNESYLENLKDPVYWQHQVDYQLEHFGRVGAGLIQDLDENGFYLNVDNKVTKKLHKDTNESVIRYPNGMKVTDIDLDRALNYQYGTDRDKDNSKYTDEEKQRAVNYWLKKTDPSPYDKSSKLHEDTIKNSKGKWVNRGEEGTHGEFRTKKAADAQRRAMFANGFGESLEDDLKSDKVDELNKRIEEIGLELDKLLDDENYDRAEFDKLACIQADMIRERESLKR